MNCPICDQSVSPFPHHSLNLSICQNCNLIFQNHSSKQSFTPNSPSWGKTDPRLTKATDEMKKRTFRLLFTHLSNLRTGLSLLDIGTGTGAFLEVAREFNLLGIGIEPDPYFSTIARKKGLTIWDKPLQEIKIPDNSFDIVTLFDVIEHFTDPLSELKKIRQALREDGLLIISTPNINSLSYKLLKSHWPHFKEEHLYYFSPHSLTLLLEYAGFTVLSQTNSIKALNLDYISGYFSAFPHPIFSPVIKGLHSLLPHYLSSLSFPVSNGNMLIIAKFLK